MTTLLRRSADADPLWIRRQRSWIGISAILFSAAEAIFISHQRANTKAAHDAAEYLEAFGLEPWLALLDADVQAADVAGDGGGLTRRIIAAIKACPRMLVIVSEAGLASEWIPFEVGAATVLEKRVGMVVMPDVDNTALPVYFALGAMLRSQPEIERWVRDERLSKSAGMRFTEVALRDERPRLAQKLQAHLHRGPRL